MSSTVSRTVAAGGVFLQEFVSLKNSGKHLRKQDFLQNYRTCSLPATREPNGQGRAVMRGGVEVGGLDESPGGKGLADVGWE